MRTSSRRKPSKIDSVALPISTRPPIRSERYDCAFCRTRLESVMYQYPPMIAERNTKQQSIAHRLGSDTRGRNGLPGRQVRSNNRSGAGRGRLRGIAFTPSLGTPGEGWGDGSVVTVSYVHSSQKLLHDVYCLARTGIRSMIADASYY